MQENKRVQNCSQKPKITSFAENNYKAKKIA
jgi:hypothetical protein